MRLSEPGRSAAAAERLPIRTEWPTVILALVIYGGWALATWRHAAMPWPIRALVGGWLLAWQGSLQHEVIHGHPTPRRWLNTLIGWIPLSLWLPFERYRSSHLDHHAAEALTEPGPDPESRYLAPRAGIAGALAKLAGELQATLLGRIIFGPIVDVVRFAASELWSGGGRGGRRIWVTHALGVFALVAWLKLVCGMDLGDYVLTFVYPGAALTLIRSYAEHRAHVLPERRVAVVEKAPILGLLFLNNNLHAVHHHHPAAPWYGLPQIYRRGRNAVLQANGGLVYDGYAEVFRRYLLRRHDVLVHPSLAAKTKPAG